MNEVHVGTIISKRKLSEENELEEEVASLFVLITQLLLLFSAQFK